MLLYSFRARHCYSHDLGPLLVRHLQVLERLQEEICSASGRGASAPLPPPDILERMIYLNLLADPPTTSIHTRTITGGNQDDKLPVGGGPDGKSPVLVRCGEAVGYCVYAMHRRKDKYGQDADQSRLELWEGGQSRNIG
ncbi:hypothetical protein S40288_07237 [Stachybotrys chartarum IBT 40288]|nr:hypothetical protein S40288_07237 [Stachybotrys chartarum IBT 40288]